MNARIVAATAVLVAALAGITGFTQHRRAREAEDGLESANRERAALQAQLAGTADGLRLAEARAAETEKDNNELLKAIAAQKSQPAPRATRMTVITPDVASLPPDEQERLAYERLHQQSLAKKRAQEAILKAKIEESAHPLEPVAKFNRLIEAVEMYLGKAEFQAARAMFNQAMGERPLDLPMTERVTQLQASLRAQTIPVDVTFMSDGATFVTLADSRMFGKLTSATEKIFPGNYEIVGRRKGFQDVVLPIQVRSGMPPPVVNIICTVPVKE